MSLCWAILQSMLLLAIGQQADDQFAVKQFMDWLRTNGADIDLIDIQATRPHYRELITSRQVEAGQQLFSIPTRLILRTSLIENHPMITDIIQKVGLSFQQDEVMLLALFVAASGEPFWQPLFDFWPKQMQNVYLWSQAEGMMIHSTLLERQHYRRIDYFRDVFAKVKPHLPFLEDSKLLWALYTVSSRMSVIDLGDGKPQAAIVPVAEVVNLARSTMINSAIEIVPNSGFVLQKATVNIPAGVEILRYYRQASNTHFLDQFGFIMPNNIQDSETFFDFATSGGPVQCVLPMDAGSQQTRSCMGNIFQATPGTGSRRLLNVIKVVWTGAQQRLTDMGPETAQEDVARLNSNEGLTLFIRQAVAVRMSEKIVAQWWTRFMEESAEVFRTIEPFSAAEALDKMSPGRGIEAWLDHMESEISSTPPGQRPGPEEFRWLPRASSGAPGAVPLAPVFKEVLDRDVSIRLSAIEARIASEEAETKILARTVKRNIAKIMDRLDELGAGSGEMGEDTGADDVPSPVPSSSADDETNPYANSIPQSDSNPYKSQAQQPQDDPYQPPRVEVYKNPYARSAEV